MNNIGKRNASQIIRGKDAIDGAGVKLRRVIGIRNTKDFDPFLMLDGFDSSEPNDYLAGFPWHPHRGIETVTYLITGTIEHGDSLGNKGIIHDLDCQWMTAGSGIIHQEMPKASKRMLGCQLWVNLPANNKMTTPSYGDIKQEAITVIKEQNAIIRIIAGNYKGNKGAFVGKHVNVKYIDVDLAPNNKWKYSEAPNNETLFIYLMEGTIAVNEDLTQFESKSCAILFTSLDKNSKINDIVEVCSGNQGARFILLTAKPLNEPIAWGGPIVMNTDRELEMAFNELDNNTFIKHQV